MHAVNDTLFWRALQGEVTERPPIWLMRQAGRSDPEYRALRASTPLELEQLFRTPELAARISLLPHRWHVDALIFFADILSPLTPMGAPFVFRPGPCLETPLHSPQDFESLREFDMVEEMPYTAATFRLIRREVGTAMPLLGFAGAPLTLFSFLAEGASPPSELPRTRAFLREHPREARRILEKIARMTVAYLKYQVASGAHAFQLFESCAHYFTRKEYLEFAVPSQQMIFDGLKGTAPGIFFARLADDHIALEDLRASGADVFSIPSTHSVQEARDVLGADTVIQGNLDNRLLALGSHDEIERAAEACIQSGGCKGHIFNLNHGVLAATPFENVVFLVDYVRQYKKA